MGPKSQKYKSWPKGENAACSPKPLFVLGKNTTVFDSDVTESSI